SETVESNPAPNEAGETAMSVDLGANEAEVSVLSSGLDAGDSVWFDNLLILDEIIEYDGPPLSGSNPVEGPSWLPGSGNSGCKFVGNPTWIANSGVNGGQIGYAATLKEVGDWQL